MSSCWANTRHGIALVGALLTLILLSVAVPAGGIPTTSGVLRQDETWSRHVRLTGDVVVPSGITLTFEPGTTIAVTPQQLHVSMPGPVQFFTSGPTTQTLFEFPLALVPTFLVPCFVGLHLASLWKLIARAA